LPAGALPPLPPGANPGTSPALKATPAPPQPTPIVSDLITKYSGGDFALDRLGRIISGIESSGGRNAAVSTAGARGIMQVMPDTAKEYGFDPSRLDDPAYNVHVGMTILADVLKRAGGDPVKAAIGYNAGPGRMADPIESLPKETRDYVDKMRAGLAIPTLPPLPTGAAAHLPAPRGGSPPLPPGATAGGAYPADVGARLAAATNPMDTPGDPGQSRIPQIPGTDAMAHSSLNELAGHQDLLNILMNASTMDNGPDAFARAMKGDKRAQVKGLIDLARDPKTNVAAAWKAYLKDPAQAMDQYGMGSPAVAQYLAKKYPNSETGRAAQFEVEHPKTAAFETLFYEITGNPMAMAEGGAAGAVASAATKSARTLDVANNVAKAAGLGSPFHEVFQRSGVEGKQWLEGMISTVKREEPIADEHMMKFFGDLTPDESWETVRLSQGLKPDPRFFSRYVDLSKRAKALREDIKHVTAEQERTGRLDASKGDIFNRETYFPMSQTHDFGPQFELAEELKGAGPPGGSTSQAKAFKNVDESRAAASWDPKASAPENYLNWRRQRMQGVAFDDALARAPESLRRDIKPEDYTTPAGRGMGKPFARSATEQPHETVDRIVAENNAHYPPGHPLRLNLKEQTEYVAAKNALQNTRSPIMQRSMIAPELWKFMQKDGQFSKYVDQGGSFLPGEETTWGQRLIGLTRAAIFTNFFYHPAVNVAGNDVAQRGLKNLGGATPEKMGYIYNAAKAVALQLGLVKPEQFVGGAQEYASWLDRALKNGAVQEFGKSRKTMFGAERARAMTEPITDKAWSEYEPWYATWAKRLDKTATKSMDTNFARTFGSKGEEAFAVSLFRDAVQKGKMSDTEAAAVTRQALVDYYDMDPKSAWGAIFMFMPFLKGNTKFWVNALVRKPQYKTAPVHAIRNYNTSQEDPGQQGLYAPPDERIAIGKDDAGGEQYFTPPDVSRDLSKLANAAMGAIKGDPGEVYYEGESFLGGRANPFTRSAIDLITTGAYAATSDLKGPESDFHAIWNPKAPPDVRDHQVATYLASHFIPVPLLGFAVEDAARKGISSHDVAAAILNAAGLGSTSEAIPEDMRRDLSKAKRTYLKAYGQYVGNPDDPDRDASLQDAWSTYMQSLKDAGAIH
jgi:hypothetical protein